MATDLSKYNIHAGTAMFTLMLSVFVDVIGYSMILPLLPGIAKTFGASDIVVGILISSNAFTALIFGPIWGKLSDKYGRKPILVVSQAGTLAAFLVLGISDSLAIIFFSRILDGMFGGQYPVIRAYITDITTPKTRSSEIGKITVGMALGMILGPLIGGFLGALNWRYPAFLASVMALISIILTLRVLVESMPKERRDDIEKILKAEGAINKKITINKEVSIRFIQLFLAFSITVMFNSSLPLVIDKRYSAGPETIGLIMGIGGTAAIFYGGFLLKRMIKKFGEKRIYLFTFAMVTILFLIYPFLYEIWMVYIFIIPFAFCMASMNPLITSNITKAVEENKQGVVSGWSTNIQSISQTISPLISTGYLQLSFLVIFSITLDSYQLIGFTAAFLGILLIVIAFYDVQKHSYLYEHENDDE
ncbi:MAG: Tetracycline resistance protein, class C [Promethearchaeota archaeon]|nr:MAG: Tetracycline resistance protein, class C [Candidatus Lokiarchaeota archaeon]